MMDRTREQLIDDIHGMALELEEKDKRIAELEVGLKQSKGNVRGLQKWMQETCANIKCTLYPSSGHTKDIITQYIAELESENKQLRAGLKNIAQNTKSFENSQNGNDWYLSIVYRIVISLLDNEEK